MFHMLRHFYKLGFELEVAELIVGNWTKVFTLFEAKDKGGRNSRRLLICLINVKALSYKKQSYLVSNWCLKWRPSIGTDRKAYP